MVRRVLLPVPAAPARRREWLIVSPPALGRSRYIVRSVRPFREEGIWYDCRVYRPDGKEVKLTPKKLSLGSGRRASQFRPYLYFVWNYKQYPLHRVVAFNCCNPHGLPLDGNHAGHIRGESGQFPWSNSRLHNLRAEDGPENMGRR
jgi:hypothetical protein